MSSLSPRMADAMLMLGLGVGIALVVRGVSFGLHTIYRDTEVAEDPDPPHAVSQGTEEGIKPPSPTTTMQYIDKSS
ncbi:hypothetical protein IWX49DRAFT_563337 [Phyllosticta citricarpa]